jgi:DNA-binding XRE family transcriptional regulator
MSIKANKSSSAKEIRWTPKLIKMLRGKRTQADFGALIGATKNTVWRWEAGRAKPEPGYVEALGRLAECEKFLKDWQLVGSMSLIGDLTEAKAEVNALFQQSLIRTAEQLGD